MADVTLETLAERLKRPCALFGLDLGTKTIGIAVSDVTWRFATPLTVISRRKFTLDVELLLKHCAERQAMALIIGLPRNMDGSEGLRAQATRSFARNLSRLTVLPIAFWDERLSTVAAERTLIEADMSRKKRAAIIDAHAAAVNLQGALDRLARILNP